MIDLKAEIRIDRHQLTKRCHDCVAAGHAFAPAIDIGEVFGKKCLKRLRIMRVDRRDVSLDQRLVAPRLTPNHGCSLTREPIPG